MEIELTIDLPCTHFNPASTTSHLDESIIIGTLEISGSDATRFKNLTIHSFASIIPSSMFISIINAQFSTCNLATSKASLKFLSFIYFLNFELPVTFVLSPTFINKESLVIFKASNPLSLQAFSITLIFLGERFSTALAMALICSGVVPQQPPIIFIKPLDAHF